MTTTAGKEILRPSGASGITTAMARRFDKLLKRGHKFFGAGLLLGKKTAAADDTVCRPARARIHASKPTPASPSQVA